MRARRVVVAAALAALVTAGCRPRTKALAEDEVPHWLHSHPREYGWAGNGDTRVRELSPAEQRALMPFDDALKDRELELRRELGIIGAAKSAQQWPLPLVDVSRRRVPATARAAAH